MKGGKEIKDILEADASRTGSIPCPHCGSGLSRVVSTRFRKGSSSKGGGVRRKRKCINCKGTYTTLEVSQDHYDALQFIRWSVIRFSRSVMVAENFFKQLTSLVNTVDVDEKIPRSFFKGKKDEEKRS